MALAGCDGEMRFSGDPLPDASGADAVTSETLAPADAAARCVRDDDCPFSTLHCDPTGACVPCFNDSQCGDSQRCVANACVQCRDKADCEPYEACDTVSHRCRKPCVDASSCVSMSTTPLCGDRGFCTCSAEICEGFPERRHCDLNRGACVECSSNDDCSSDDEKYCSDGFCVRCKLDAHCSGDKRCDPVTHQCVN